MRNELAHVPFIYQITTRRVTSIQKSRLEEKMRKCTEIRIAKTAGAVVIFAKSQNAKIRPYYCTIPQHILPKRFGSEGLVSI